MKTFLCLFIGANFLVFCFYISFSPLFHKTIIFISEKKLFSFPAVRRRKRTEGYLAWKLVYILKWIFGWAMVDRRRRSTFWCFYFPNNFLRGTKTIANNVKASQNFKIERFLTFNVHFLVFCYNFSWMETFSIFCEFVFCGGTIFCEYGLGTFGVTVSWGAWWQGANTTTLDGEDI